MKKLFLLAILSVATLRLAADGNPMPQPPQPTPQPQSTMISIPKTVSGLKPINLRIEPLSDDQMKNGLSMDALKDMVMKRLSDSDITISANVTQPILILRVRSIPSGVDIATYFQLSLMEESMLLRNRSMYNAITWSQASLLSCRPEELQKEVAESVDSMVQAFAKDYKKAFAPVITTN